MNRKGTLLLAVLITVSMLLAACGAPEPETIVQTVEVEKEVVKEVEKVVTEIVEVEKEVTTIVEGTPIIETVVETQVVEVEKVITATPEPAAGGGTLTIASTSDIDNYDPHWNQLISFKTLVGHNIFDYLTDLDADMQVVPLLAESWEISDDGTVYTFKLREGAMFHNGRPLTAEDVVYSFNRVTDQETIFANKMDPVESIEALDDYTVQFTLKAPWAPFLSDLTLIAIVGEDTEAQLQTEPIGSGPFRFVEWLPNDQIVLEKNPDYDVEGVPKLDGIVIKILPDQPVALTNLEAGSVDAVYDVPAAQADRFKGRDDFVIQTPKASNSLFLLEMAIAKYEPLQDARVRKALAMCLDKETINQNVYFGQAGPQWSSLPKSSWAHIEPAEIPYDPDGAQALLAEAGYTDGFDLTVKIITGVGVMENLTTIWQDCLGKIGVNLEIEVEELSTWLDHYVGRDYQTIANWMNVQDDPHSMYDTIFKPHLNDETSYPNEEMLALIEEGAVTTDQGRRKAIYAQIQQMAVDEMAPVIVVVSQPVIGLTSPKVKDWTMNSAGLIYFDKIYLEE
jgi:peptide/nickel transport system substrate-binding protein